jgi:hypothetical protein
VNSQITDGFLACFARLPDAVKVQARKAYRLWKENPSHPGLQYKQIQGQKGLYSVRVNQGWRTLGLVEGNTITWFWIGSHADFDKLLAQF